VTGLTILVLCVIVAALESSLARTRNDLRTLRRQVDHLAATLPTVTTEERRHE
jgi:hypothetical protein